MNEEIVNISGKFSEKIFEGRDSRIVLFCGSKGGCGCSFIANCVASYLAINKDSNIVLVDLNSGRTDSRIIFSTEDNARDIGDLPMGQEIDLSLIKRLVINYENSMNLVLPPLNYGSIRKQSSEKIQEFTRALACCFNLVLYDMPYNFLLNSHPSLIEDIDSFILVSQADTVSINNLEIMIKNIISINPSASFEIIINRFNLRPSISPARITRMLKYPVKAYIPYDRDIEFLYLTRGTFPVFNYNLRIVKSIRDFSDNFFGTLFESGF